MDAALMLRSIIALCAVLAMLGGALWLVRRYDIRLPGQQVRSADRLALAGRITLDARRCIALIRHGADEHLLLIAPEGNLLLGAGERRDFIREEDREMPLHIDLALCREITSSVPLPPPATVPHRPAPPRRPHEPRHDPLPLSNV